MKKILITGCAGFIGYHLSYKLLLDKKYHIYGIDCLDDYYDIDLKKNRLKSLKNINSNFTFYKVNLINEKKIKKIFQNNKFDYVVNLAAQAGVRYSILNPRKYLDSNVLGFFNLLDACNKNHVKHFVFASTSSVYGHSEKFPLTEDLNTDKPQSFYAATKKTNEVMAYAYSNIYKLPCTGLRFFTVYGPFGRPDMSLYKFTEAIFNDQKIELFNNGNHIRDFTFIDDIVEGVIKVLKKPSKEKIPYNIFNIGSNSPKHLKKFLDLIERELGKKTLIQNKKLQKGDVYKTHASINKIKTYTGYLPKYSIKYGIKKFIEWYKIYHKK